LKNPRLAVNEADRTDRASYFPGDEYLDNSDEETIANIPENCERYKNSIKVTVLSYAVDRRKEIRLPKE